MSKKVKAKKKKEPPKSEFAQAATAIGAIGGVAAIRLGAKKIGISQRHAEWGFLLGGGVVALVTKGWVRGMATGVATAGALSLAVSWLQSRQEKRNAQVVVVKRKRSSWWGDLITREDVERALADPSAKTDERDPALTEQQRAHIAKVRSRLTPAECGRFDAIMHDAETSTERHIYGHLLRLPTSEGVAYLRNKVLRGEL